MRGACSGDSPAPHLLAALDQDSGTVLTQARVADKSNEIPALPELLEPLDLDGAVVSADATVHPGGHRPVDPRSGRSLRAHCQGQPEDPVQGAQGPALEGRPISWVDVSHGRRVRRTVKAVEAPAWVGFPGAAQVVQIRRTRTTRNRKNAGKNGKAKTTTVEVVYLVCSLPMEQAQPEQVAAWVQEHWGIENRLHVGP